MIEAVRLTLMFAAAGLLIAAAVSDLRRYIIPNWLCATLALLAIPYWLITWKLGGGDLVWTLGVQTGQAFVVFALLALLFMFGVMGGGDVKLMAALALWLPLPELLTTAFWISIFGFILAAGLFVRARMRGQPSPDVPYGIAIGAGGLLALGEPILKVLMAM